MQVDILRVNLHALIDVMRDEPDNSIVFEPARAFANLLAVQQYNHVINPEWFKASTEQRIAELVNKTS